MKDELHDIIFIVVAVGCFMVGFLVRGIDPVEQEAVVIDYNYSEDDLYEQRLMSMDTVVDEMFPVHNQTVTITNGGYVPDRYDWENNTRLFEGGWIIHVNHSYYGESEYIFDGWVLKIFNK